MQVVDLVVVGAGTAGIPAAIAAADRGATVLLLEKHARVGGTLAVSSATFSGAATRLQRARGIADSPEDHYKDVMRLAHDKADPDLVRTAVHAQGAMVDWLEDLGFDFDPDVPSLYYGHELYTIPRTYYGRSRLALLELFERELAARVARSAIQLRLNTALTGLVRAADGQVTGVRANANEEISAAAVLITTGGYGANRELVSRFLPRGFGMALSACFAGATGDGLLRAEEIGAAVTDYGYYIPSMGLIPDPDRPGFAFDYNDASVSLLPSVRLPYEVWVNLRGERFVAEDTPSPEERERRLLQQPELTMAVVWDQHALDTATPVIGPAEQGWTAARIAAEAERGAFIWKAETLHELATCIGVDPAGLERTLETYNASVAAGRDAQFGRTLLPAPLAQPPFYAVRSQAGFLTVREGLKVDGDLRVLDESGKPIPNLYAAGEVLGVSQLMGDNMVGGMAVGPAIGLGRLLGQRLADAALATRADVTSAVAEAGG